MGLDGMGWDGMGWDGRGGGREGGSYNHLDAGAAQAVPENHVRSQRGRQRYAPCNMQHRQRNIQRTTRNIQRTTRNAQHAPRNTVPTITSGLSTARWQPRGLACESSARTCVWRRAALGLCYLVCASVDGRVARASLTRLGCDGLHGGLCVVLSRMQRAPLANACNWERPPRSRAGKRERFAVLWCWACCMMRPSTHALAPPAAVAELLRRPEIVALKRRMASRGSGTRHLRGMHAVYTLQARGTHATCATKRHR